MTKITTPKKPSKELAAKTAAQPIGKTKPLLVAPEKPDKKPKATTTQIRAAMRLNFAAPQYAILEEVRNGTGLLKKRNKQQPRYADMLAMSLWPSLGLEILGFEIKVSRADWLHEISDEKKAVAVSQFCDRWYLVVPDAGLVKDGELPEHWGLIEMVGAKMKIIKKAPKLEAAPVTREFLASLLRNATTNNHSTADVEAQVALATTVKPVVAKVHRRRSRAINAASKRIENRKKADEHLKATSTGLEPS